MAVEQGKMEEGLHRLPEEYQKTNEGIERLISLIAKSDAESKKQVMAMAKQYHKDITKIVKDQDKTQKEVALYVSELKKAGATDKEIAAYLRKNVKLTSGEENLTNTMKAMQDNLNAMADTVKFKSDEDRKLAERQSKTLEKYFKDKTKSKPQSWAERKAKAVKEETGGALKESLAKGLGVGFQTLLGPLRMIVDPALKLGGIESITLFEKIIEKSNQAETARTEETMDRFDNLTDVYTDEEKGWKQEKRNSPNKKKPEESLDDILDDVRETLADEDTKKPKRKASARLTEELPVEDRLPSRTSKKPEESLDDILDDQKIPNIFDTGKESESEEELAGLMDHLEPTRSSLLKRGGIIGAAAVFLANILDEEEGPKPDKAGKDKDSLNFFGLPGGSAGMKRMITKLLPALKGVLPFAAIAAGGAMLAGGMALQKRDTEDSKKYANRGQYDRAAETFLLGDRERITEETAGSELGRTTGKAALVAGGTGLMVAGGAGVAAMGSTVATAGGIAAAGGLGAVGTAGVAALGAALPPVLIAAAIVAAGAAVAKGTQEAYELEYDKNAATIQRDLQRTLMDEEAPFLKRVGAGFKSEWIELTSTLAGGIRGAADTMDVEAERQLQTQLDILKKQADEGNAESARLYEIMSQENFRAMSKKEKETLLKSEALYNEYMTVVNESEGSFWDKLKRGAKVAVKAVEGAVNTANENLKGEATALWEKNQLKDMESLPSADIDRLKNSEAYQNALGESGDLLKAMQEAFLDERKTEAIARGDLDTNGMVVSLFDKIKLGMKSFTDISDEAIRQSTEFDTRRLQLMAEGKSAEEADQQAMEEQRDLLNSQMELRLKQTKEYKDAFDKAVKEGKSLKDAEREALSKVKQNKNYLRSFGQSLSEGLRSLWEGARDIGSRIWDSASSAASGVWDWITGGGRSSDEAPVTPDASIHDGIVYKSGKVVSIDDNDNIIATQSEPVIGDREISRADAVPIMPAASNFSDVNIVDVLTRILTTLEKKDFSPIINAGNSDGGMNFDSLRTAGAL